MPHYLATYNLACISVKFIGYMYMFRSHQSCTVESGTVRGGISESQKTPPHGFIETALQMTGRTSNPKQQIIKLQEHLWAGNLRFNNQPSGGIADNDHPRKELSSGGQGLVSLSKQYQASEKLTAFYPRFYYNSKQNSSSRISIVNGYRWLSIYLQKNVYTFSPYCSPRRTFLESFRFLRRYETWAVSF